VLTEGNGVFKVPVKMTKYLVVKERNEVVADCYKLPGRFGFRLVFFLYFSSFDLVGVCT
jgi:hypothetical protein